MDPNLSAFNLAKLTLTSVCRLEVSVAPTPSSRSFTGYVQLKKFGFSILHWLKGLT